MKIGLQVPNFTWPEGPARMGSKLADIARAADEAGFYSLWVMDHFFQISMIGPPENDMLEAYTTLGYLAALTRRVKLGTMVTGVVYRHPGVLVKSATTLDVLSGGRAYFAIGAAWNEHEARGLGVPFPPLGVRFEMLEETLQIAKQMWSENNGPYRGKHYQLEQTLCVPQPLSRPHPPILVAGGGEKKTLRLVAQYADACNLYGSVETIRAKLDILKQHCQTLGRDYRTIEITTLGTLDLQPGKMSSKEVIAHCKALAGIGVQHAVFNMPTVHELAPIERFRRQIIPAVAAY
ncbi:MAG TPA: LLM class F420-dependent oxidoreductase [Steroidobacteraceae bacterium]|nr:LLM class F420-dependent oxidoreductase [Steroidobacteraceae bacterium]